MASLAEGGISCAILLDYLYPACTSSITLTIQPPNLIDTDDLISGSPGSFMVNFVVPSTGFDKKTNTYFSGLANTTQKAVMYLLTYLLL